MVPVEVVSSRYADPSSVYWPSNDWLRLQAKNVNSYDTRDDT